MQFTDYLLVATSFVFVYTFVSGFVGSIVKCWRDAAPKNNIEETTFLLDELFSLSEQLNIEENHIIDEFSIDLWEEEIEIPSTEEKQIEVITSQLILPPAKLPKKSISKMIKDELVKELGVWRKPTEGTVKELRTRLKSCYC